MARYLAIDYDHPRLHILSVSTAKGHVRVEQSLSWALDEELTTARANSLGKKLHDALEAGKIAPAPVLWCVGRDKVILKEMTVPFVPIHEEPTVVRFQAAKDMTETPGEVALDYAYMSPPQAGKPTHVLAVMLRKATVQAVTGLCQSAGLKLQAMTPRPMAIAGLLSRTPAPATVPIHQAILLPHATGVEFSVFTGETLAWARTLAAGPGLTAEVQRNLMLVAAQKGDSAAVQKVLVAGLPELGPLPVPVEFLQPWLPEDSRPTPPEPFLAPLGLAVLQSLGKIPVNLATPKEPRQVTDSSERRKKLSMIAATVILPLALIGYWWSLSNKRAAIVELQEQKDDLESKWKNLAQDRLNVEALKEWNETTISWIDELHDVAARWPHVQGLRITQLSALPLPRRGAKDKLVGRMTLHGVMGSDQDSLVYQFLESVHKDAHLRASPPNFKAQEFTLKIDVAPQPPDKFGTALVIPPQPKKVVEPEPEMTEGDQP